MALQKKKCVGICRILVGKPEEEFRKHRSRWQVTIKIDLRSQILGLGLNSTG
jgi:hypothetical protein